MSKVHPDEGAGIFTESHCDADNGTRSGPPEVVTVIAVDEGHVGNTAPGRRVSARPTPPDDVDASAIRRRSDRASVQPHISDTEAPETNGRDAGAPGIRKDRERRSVASVPAADRAVRDGAPGVDDRKPHARVRERDVTRDVPGYIAAEEGGRDRLGDQPRTSRGGRDRDPAPASSRKDRADDLRRGEPPSRSGSPRRDEWEERAPRSSRTRERGDEREGGGDRESRHQPERSSRSPAPEEEAAASSRRERRYEDERHTAPQPRPLALAARDGNERSRSGSMRHAASHATMDLRTARDFEDGESPVGVATSRSQAVLASARRSSQQPSERRDAAAPASARVSFTARASFTGSKVAPEPIAGPSGPLKPDGAHGSGYPSSARGGYGQQQHQQLGSAPLPSVLDVAGPAALSYVRSEFDDASVARIRSELLGTRGLVRFLLFQRPGVLDWDGLYPEHLAEKHRLRKERQRQRKADAKAKAAAEAAAAKAKREAGGDSDSDQGEAAGVVATDAADGAPSGDAGSEAPTTADAAAAPTASDAVATAESAATSAIAVPPSTESPRATAGAVSTSAATVSRAAAGSGTARGSNASAAAAAVAMEPAPGGGPLAPIQEGKEEDAGSKSDDNIDDDDSDEEEDEEEKSIRKAMLQSGYQCLDMSLLVLEVLILLSTFITGLYGVYAEYTIAAVPLLLFLALGAVLLLMHVTTRQRFMDGLSRRLLATVDAVYRVGLQEAKRTGRRSIIGLMLGGLMASAAAVGAAHDPASAMATGVAMGGRLGPRLITRGRRRRRSSMDMGEVEGPEGRPVQPLDETAERLRDILHDASRTVHRQTWCGYFTGVIACGGIVTALVLVPGFLSFFNLSTFGVFVLTIACLVSQWHLGAVSLWCAIGEPSMLLQSAEILCDEYLHQLRDWKRLRNDKGSLDIHWAVSAHRALRNLLQDLSESLPVKILLTGLFVLSWLFLGAVLVMFVIASPRFNWAWLVCLLLGILSLLLTLRPLLRLSDKLLIKIPLLISSLRADAALAVMESPTGITGINLARHIRNLESLQMYVGGSDIAIKFFGLRLSKPAILAASAALTLIFLYLVREVLIASGVLRTWY